MKRTPLKRSQRGLTGNGRLAPFSKKTREGFKARRECIEAVKARDVVCQFWARVIETPMSQERFEFFLRFRHCRGPLEVHEPAHRRNSDITSPDACMLLCQRHNQWAEIEPRAAYEIGLLVKGNGLPLRKGLHS